MAPPIAHPPLLQVRLPARRPLRSLTLKLTLAFLIVGLTGALLVSLFAGLGTQRALTQFVSDRVRTSLVNELASYYTTNGGWSGVETVLDWAHAQQDAADGGRVPPPLLCNVDGTIIAGTGRYPLGTRLPTFDRDKGAAITVNSKTVGYLITEQANRPAGPGSPESDFVGRITQAITFSAIGATGIALLLGIVLARTLTHPVRELTAATQAVAKGALGQQVPVRSRDELGALATSFNQMSTDLEHASTLRRQMTADIAHDLRTPLSVIIGYTEALREGKLPADQDIFDTLHTEAQLLLHLVDDLRTLSLADAGELPLARQPLAPQALLERTTAAYRAQASDRGITLRVDAAADLPEIDVDPERIAQVLGNLVSNALRFTPAAGTIALTATPQAGGVVLGVRDTGSGIAAADLPHVFERFYRADSARQQADGSSGLGLAIAKGIVEAHAGTIAVESAPGAGTRFTIVLPAA